MNLNSFCVYWIIIKKDISQGRYFYIYLLCRQGQCFNILVVLEGYLFKKVKVKVPHSLIAVGAVGVRVPLYLGHS